MKNLLDLLAELERIYSKFLAYSRCLIDDIYYNVKINVKPVVRGWY